MKIVYRYGLTAPTENADVVYAEMRQAHTYRNVLVEIERGRRAALRSLDSDEVQTLAREVLALDAACEERIESTQRQIESERIRKFVLRLSDPRQVHFCSAELTEKGKD